MLGLKNKINWVNTVTFLSLAVSVYTNYANAQVSLEKGKEIASAACSGCHGADGNSALPVNPILAGQHAGYLAKQMADFKPNKHGDVTRKNDVMMGMAALVNGDDIKSVSEFYATQKPIPAKSTKPELKKIAEKLYRGGDTLRSIPPCSGCHGPAGAGIPSKYPAIAGQHFDYTQTTLLDYRSGKRQNDPDGVMQTISRHLSDKEIEALSDYLVGMRFAD